MGKKGEKGGAMDERVVIRMDAALRKALEKMAKDERRDLSDMIRCILLDRIEGKEGGK